MRLWLSTATNSAASSRTGRRHVGIRRSARDCGYHHLSNQQDAAVVVLRKTERGTAQATDPRFCRHTNGQNSRDAVDLLVSGLVDHNPPGVSDGIDPTEGSDCAVGRAVTDREPRIRDAPVDEVPSGDPAPRPNEYSCSGHPITSGDRGTARQERDASSSVADSFDDWVPSRSLSTFRTVREERPKSPDPSRSKSGHSKRLAVYPKHPRHLGRGRAVDQLR